MMAEIIWFLCKKKLGNQFPSCLWWIARGSNPGPLIKRCDENLLKLFILYPKNPFIPFFYLANSCYIILFRSILNHIILFQFLVFNFRQM